jgi:hypothetical protein
VRVKSPSGFFFVALGLLMLGCVAYAGFHQQVYFLARRKGVTIVDMQSEPALFWFVIAFLAVGGIVATWFGIRVVRGST